MKTKVWKIVRWGVSLFFASTILAVVVLRFIPVYFTPLMFIRCFQQIAEGKSMTLHHHWVPIDEISDHLPVAVMASEDQRFLLHHGFDYDAIEKAAKRNIEGGKRKLGASTISQQTAKNVFLWPGRSWVRKGFEVYFTALTELLWSKQRIMEVYLNSIEMGDGIYGADAVAEYHFGKKAEDLSRSDCALIAATLPNPRKFSSKSPGSYMRKRQRQILSNMRFIPSFPKEGSDYNPSTAAGGVYSK
ncbi:MAG: monofunctional biosynthetic peptidoglycan transglycosylase [Prevotella sp.]|jgi:monofunctional biosynthetic peptidoglycan transglycosylase|nr:monofunctional biosynthetic peptidoglycan transglycosylase [Prevotella sp.]MBP9984832.1 monofunctional biosynthetic peptidoglycan transglycosylase [Prevotella sp.]MDY0154539.1 monofunctional biosynthetic peptidoglycan transglycosylase [Prevotella sp.]